MHNLKQKSHDGFTYHNLTSFQRLFCPAVFFLYDYSSTQIFRLVYVMQHVVCAQILADMGQTGTYLLRTSGKKCFTIQYAACLTNIEKKVLCLI